MFIRENLFLLLFSTKYICLIPKLKVSKIFASKKEFNFFLIFCPATEPFYGTCIFLLVLILFKFFLKKPNPTLYVLSRLA